jgi:uncharacterized protein (TIGR00251 family)
MKITVEVKPRAKKEGVEKLGENHFSVRVNVPPLDGKANDRVVELLSEYLKIPKSKIRLSGGHKSKRKTFDVE